MLSLAADKPNFQTNPSSVSSFERRAVDEAMGVVRAIEKRTMPLENLYLLDNRVISQLKVEKKEVTYDLSDIFSPKVFGCHESICLWMVQMIDSDDVDDFLVTFMQPPKTAGPWAAPLEGIGWSRD